MESDSYYRSQWLDLVVKKEKVESSTIKKRELSSDDEWEEFDNEPLSGPLSEPLSEPNVAESEISEHDSSIIVPALSKTRFNPLIAPGTVFTCSYDTWYLCSFCDMKLKPRANMIRHMRLKHDPMTKPFGCKFCVARFEKSDALESHESSSHNDGETPSTIFCEACGASGNHEKGMKQHKTHDHSGEERAALRSTIDAAVLTICDICGMKLRGVDEMECHMVEKHVTFHCKRCTATFKKKSSLRRHVVSFHEENTKCLKCNEKFAGQSKLRHHTMMVHDKLFRVCAANEIQHDIKCCVCKTQFGSEGDLLDHLKIHLYSYKKLACSHWRVPIKSFESFVAHSKYHAKPKTHECLRCKKKFPLDSKFFIHINGHKQTHRKFKCDKCSSKFRSEQELETHDKVKHQKQTLFICPICAKSLSSEIVLNNHIKYIHERDMKHECKICSRKFTRQNRLFRHQATHSTDRPFPCELEKCESTFKTIEGLRIHMKRHNGTLVKRFTCNHCSFKATTRNRIDIHLLTHSGLVSLFDKW